MKCYNSIYSAWYPNAKDYSDEHVAGQIFKQQVKTKDLRSYYQYQMFAYLKTLERVNNALLAAFDAGKKKELSLLLQLTQELVSEGIEYLNFVSVETEGASRNYGIGKRGVLNSKELFDASIMLLHGDFDIRRFGRFSLAPTSVMVLRQAIELRLRNAVGVHLIREKDGRITKLPQKFFFSFIKSHASDVNLPVDLFIVEKIFDWTQTYVHGGVLKQTWEIEWAFHLLKPLFASKRRADRGFHYLGAIEIRQSLIQNLPTEVNRALGRRTENAAKLLQIWERLIGRDQDPVELELLPSPDAHILQ